MSHDKEYIVDFIKHICDKDFAQAGNAMHAAITEKVKNRIRDVKKDDVKDDKKMKSKSKADKA